MYVMKNSLILTSQRRSIWSWLNPIFNGYSKSRVNKVGPDCAAAEWLIRCGAKVKWEDSNSWDSNYDSISKSTKKIVAIDATDSCLMHRGFPYLKGLSKLNHIQFNRCHYLDDPSLEYLALVKDSLEKLEITSCGNITDRGIVKLVDLESLKYLHLYDLPSVKSNEKCLKVLKQSLKNCEIIFPLE